MVRQLRRALRGCQTVLDIGCGVLSPMRFLQTGCLVGVDGHVPAIEQARRNATHDEYFCDDVRRLGERFGERRFDGCVALDLIEHLPKDDGWRLLDQMEALAKHRVIILTPNGFLPQQSQDGDLQQHLSGWTAAEMRTRGYQVSGMYGPKSLRGAYHRIQCRPRPLWSIISILLHFVSTRNCPEKAAAIFCVKDNDSPG
ncbi:MAG TPA: class I SAM-dependent methyltransferase [Verrucomicrobiae bacterium]